MKKTINTSNKLIGLAYLKKYNPNKFRGILKKAHKVLKKKKLGFYSFETQSKGGKIGGKNAQIILREKKLGFYDPKVQSLGGKIAQKTLREKKISAFYDPKIRKKICKKGGQKANLINRKNKTGFYGLTLEQRREIVKKSHQRQKINKTGFCNSELQKELSKRAYASRIKNSPYVWKNVGFLSKQELECSKILLENEKPIKNINCHVKIGNKIFDFKINNTFIEYHCFDENNKEIKAIYGRSLSYLQYYKKRRKVLDENGYKDDKLIIFKNLKEVKEFKNH